MPEPGQQTEDLRQLRPPPDDEARTQRFGRRCFWTGIATVFSMFLACLATAIVSDQHVYESRAAQLFGMLSIIPLMLLGAALILLGGIEHLQRSLRAQQRQIWAQLLKLTEDTDERLEVMIGLVAPVPGRLDQFAERVDTGGKVYLERLERVEQAMAVVAEHLPDEMLKRHWQGYNDAVREGFAGQQNGTEGSHRPPHLGLVPHADD